MRNEEQENRFFGLGLIIGLFVGFVLTIIGTLGAGRHAPYLPAGVSVLVAQENDVELDITSGWKDETEAGSLRAQWLPVYHTPDDVVGTNTVLKAQLHRPANFIYVVARRRHPAQPVEDTWMGLTAQEKAGMLE